MASPKITAKLDSVWAEYKKHPTVELRNQLMEAYMPIVKYNGEPLETIVPGMVPAAAWERFNGGEPPHEGDDATYPKKTGKTEQGVKAVGELNNGL